MTEEFKEWYKEKYPHHYMRSKKKKGVYKTERLGFELLSWEMQWGIYQLYFWSVKKWWLSIYPYTDKFGGKIRGFWDEGHYTCDFITNVPHQAQEQLVKAAFKKLKEDKKII